MTNLKGKLFSVTSFSRSNDKKLKTDNGINSKITTKSNHFLEETLKFKMRT
jgi:hypothetical protein